MSALERIFSVVKTTGFSSEPNFITFDPYILTFGGRNLIGEEPSVNLRDLERA